MRDFLLEKHPDGQPARAISLLPNVENSDLYTTHPVWFYQISESTIRTAALRTEGSVGPSCIDALGWRLLCYSFGRCSSRPLARHLCISFPHPASMEAYNACRLIALNKLPSVHPIGICEVVLRIIGKAVMSVVKPYVINAVGPLQLCAGQMAGCEVGVHALNSMFETSTSEGVQLVDAKNARQCC